MTSQPPNDPLVSLWQTAPKPDTHHLLQDLQRVNHLHQRLNRSVFAIVCGMSLLLIFEEATGRVTTHGALSVIWVLGIAIGIVWRRRARCNRSVAFALDTISLLKFLIARAKSDMFIARCLYAGVPCCALVGYIVATIMGISASPRAIATHPRLHLIQTAAGIAALIIMMVTGAILARAGRRQIREFRYVQTQHTHHYRLMHKLRTNRVCVLSTR
jgi:hypothetical protein